MDKFEKIDIYDPKWNRSRVIGWEKMFVDPNPYRLLSNDVVADYTQLLVSAINIVNSALDIRDTRNGNLACKIQILRDICVECLIGIEYDRDDFVLSDLEKDALDYSEIVIRNIIAYIDHYTYG